MRLVPFAALALGLALAACETVPRAHLTFPDEPNVWVSWNDEGFHGDTVGTFHNGTSRDVCVRERGYTVGGYLIPANSTIRRQMTVPGWDDAVVVYDPARFNGCRVVQPR